MQHPFFQGFIPQQGQVVGIQNTTPETQHNEMVLEFYNNWEEVVDFFGEMIRGEITTVDNTMTKWISFINSNGLDLTTFEDRDDFEEKMTKTFKITD